MKPLVLLVLILGLSARASSALQMDVPALARAASDIVHARVTHTRCAWTEDHQRLVTFVEVEVLEPLKGKPSHTLTVLQLGGVRDGIGQRVAGVSPLETGEEVVLFLERQGDVFRVVGLSQGVYRIERSMDGSLARAVPASVNGLELRAPQGAAPQPRETVSFDALRSDVRREVSRE